MGADKAGEEYWNAVWDSKTLINEIDIEYYTNKLLHELYRRYLPIDGTKTIVEIGCAFSSYLPYFHKHFGYRINGFDYEPIAVERTKQIYESMGLEANIYYRDFFSDKEAEKYDVVTSFGVFEHFENLRGSIAHTKLYIKKGGIIVTLIPNMNGIIGLLQKSLNQAVYDIHIPYTREDLKDSHEAAGYKTLFCDYYGLYQGGVVNLSGNRYENALRKLLAVPGKPLYHFHRLTNIRLDSKYLSPYVIYIGKLGK
ncbi:methyltransferase domain-containing protein [Nitratifractor sp.]|uniref:class I SAM-dependent methyltransferase n=1 Tax=Nitratifractor sp. TaxID=2268144 RepID=UPI0025F8BD52|nr:methyltransferase domain-containing protein [Nitratifractor sp.]